jgi:hypothetical protein
MTNPSPFLGTRHLQIVTDERATCRQRRDDGSCRVDDFAFGLPEQYSPVVTSDPRVTTVELREGHAAVVGENGFDGTGGAGARPRRHSATCSAPPRRRRERAAALASARR